MVLGLSSWFGLAALLGFVVIGAWLWTPDKLPAELEAKYRNASSSYLEVAGIRLHVRDTGPKDGRAVILLHGLGSSLHTWEPWAQSLSNKYRVIRYDLPGFALTGVDPTGDYSESRGMQILAALMANRSIRRASLIGNSMGGRLTWKFAAEYPERIDKLVLISPDGFESPGYEYGKAPAVPAIVKMMKFFLPKAMLRANLEPAYGDPTKLTEATMNRYYDLMLAPGVRSAMISRMEQTILERPEPLLQKITAPTLLLWGAKDAMIPIANAADYLKALPNAKIVKLPHLGHVPHEEAPDRSLQPVRAFLDGESSATP